MIELALPATVVKVDVVRSTSGNRSREGHLHRGLEKVLDDALAESPYSSDDWFRRPDGDSVTLVARGSVPKAWIASDFVRAIQIALRRQNEHSERSRLRLRMAIAHGEIELERQHVRGRAVRIAARLCDGDAFREYVASRRDELALVVSDRFFHEVIEEQERDLDPAEFHEVVVRSKDGLIRGWIRGVKTSRRDRECDPGNENEANSSWVSPFPSTREPTPEAGSAINTNNVGRATGKVVVIGSQKNVADKIINKGSNR